ncbi:WD40-repeat-containing domain protein [Gymnopilus junonius]|uniref:WD40-repeat-containing domain protein n=1 Tax=Gymnopilus junonius TaxID=109634 RepID=A0A9P5NPJ4_GYMJU|nr:WD40-repeat-containing domain protein [Gymnopilus junonius]
MSNFDELSYTTPPSPPFDSISSIRYSPTNPDQLLVSSWDTTVRFYEIGENGVKPSEAKAKFDHRAAVLACAFSADAAHAYSGGLDTSVRELDLSTEKITNLGAHSDSISSMTFARTNNVLITGSWDRTIRFWDPRAATPQQSSYSTPNGYTPSITSTTRSCSYGQPPLPYYDIRKMDKPAQERESSLKYMTRSLACMPDGQGYATASVEGRIAVEYFDPSPASQDKKYAFKCHRQTIDEVDHVWPVNSLAFHPIYNTFASAGLRRDRFHLDHKVKKRLRQYPKYPGPVAAVAFNCDGTKIAVGVSYTWDEGEAGLKANPVTPWLGVRKVGDEVKPKSWAG